LRRNRAYRRNNANTRADTIRRRKPACVGQSRAISQWSICFAYEEVQQNIRAPFPLFTIIEWYDRRFGKNSGVPTIVAPRWGVPAILNRRPDHEQRLSVCIASNKPCWLQHRLDKSPLVLPTQSLTLMATDGRVWRSSCKYNHDAPKFWRAAGNRTCSCPAGTRRPLDLEAVPHCDRLAGT